MSDQTLLNLEAPTTPIGEQVDQHRLVRPWSASISPEEMAVHMCGDLLQKFRQLDAMPEERAKAIAEGIVDGLKDVSFPHPIGGIPNYLKSMEPDYCAGHQVGSTWRRIANEWPNKEITHK